MSDVTIIQTNFTAGEVSPRILGRTDIDRYKNGAQEIVNCLPLIHGGLKSTPMLRFNAETKYPNSKSRLIRFEFSKTEANMLEFGHEYIRFFNQDRTQVFSGNSPYEIVTPYQEGELFQIEYIGGADTIFLFHENHPVQRLRRFQNDYWVIDDAPFDPQPFTEQGHRPAANIAISDSSVGTGRTITSNPGVFVAADVGRHVAYNGGLAVITAYTSANNVTADVLLDFNVAIISSGNWILEGSPQAVCTPSKNGLLGENITLSLSAAVRYENSKTLKSASYSNNKMFFETQANHDWSVNNIVVVDGCTPALWNGTYRIAYDFYSGGEAGPDTVFDTLTPDGFAVDLPKSPGSITSLGVAKRVISGASSVEGWRPDDVGSFVQINGGLVEITEYASQTSVAGVIRQAMTSDVGAQAGSWLLKKTIWNQKNGYPRTGVFYQQRLIVGGSPAFPHTIACSRIGEYLNFELGLNDDDAYLYTLDVSEYDPILHLSKSKNQVIVLTSGNEFTITGGVEAPMTVTNTQVDNPSDYGCNDVRPVRVDNELIFVNRTGKKFRAMGYRFESDAFASSDLTKLSEHITGNGVTDLAYQQETESIIWAVREDGQMIILAIDREENVIAWARQLTDGLFESVEAIPSSGIDEVWCIVKRVINGQTVRYIESYDASIAYGLHSGITSQSNDGQMTWGGLDHLEGKLVDIIADGNALTSKTVAGGQITLDRPAYNVAIGLPARAYIKTLNPEVFTQSGSSQNRHIRAINTTLRLLDSYCANINDQYVDFRRFGPQLLDRAPPVFTGDIQVNNLGWSKSQSNEIRQANPLPFHLLAIIMRVSVDD